MDKHNRKLFAGYLKKNRIRLAIAVFCAIIGTLSEVAAPYLTGRAIDNIIGVGNVDFAAVTEILALLMILYLLSGAMSYIVAVVAYKSAHGVAFYMRRDAFEKLQRMSIEALSKISYGDITSRFVNDATLVADGILETVMQLITGVITIVGTLSIMLSLNLIVTAAVFSITLITFAVGFVITKLCNKYFKQNGEKMGQLSAVVEEYTEIIHTVKAYSYEEKALEKFQKCNNELKTAGQKAVFYSSLANPSTRFVNYLAYISVGVIGGIFAHLSPGAISSFILYSNQFAKPFNQITAVITQLLSAWASANRIMNFLQSDEQNDSKDAINIESTMGEIEFKNVCFSYRNDKPLIENFSLKVSHGQKVAIVGPTGSGKTTLVNLIMRFYDPQSGEILLDNINIKDISLSGLRKNIAMVLQETWLKNSTVKENIAYGRQQATDEEIVMAAKKSHADSFIKRLPNGYDTVIKNSSSISQGQKQLLTIARAMLSKSPIL
ncbi:MAG: ABC transporter ATP-binding protein, partial [Oscillospiraceae bacterium]